MVWMPRLLFASALCSLIVVSTVATRAAELVMLEEAGCSYCQQWNEEIGVVYHKTVEGQRLPLRRVDIHDPLPKDLAYLVKGGYTPTFIVVDKGREFGRIRGYPGEDFFWGLLGQLIKRLSPDETNNRQIN
jgi:thioredoxin-related protein